MRSIILILSMLIILKNGFAQNDSVVAAEITYHINENVKNKEEKYFKEIEQNWKDYLNTKEFVRSTNNYWNNNEMPFPDYSYISLLLDLSKLNKNIQCTILGLIPVENGYYLLKTMFTHYDDSSNRIELKYIVSVYTKWYENKYQFINSTQYHKEIYENKRVGNINYIIHPDHKFQKADAQKMDKFNSRIAALFEIDPIKFDYVVANNTTDLANIMGLNFFSYSYQPNQSGGMADNFNTIIFAGNNSAYYPHEVVHLYTNAKFPRQYHPWVDEGIAAFLGGSTGYKLEWHVQKLRSFLKENPNYELYDLSKLQIDIPNGEYTTDFRYAIGGFLCSKIYESEGMQGLFDALQAGRSEDDYFKMLFEKLGIKRNEFENYIKKEVLSLDEIKPEELEKLKY